MPQWTNNISLAVIENGDIFVVVRNSGGNQKGYRFHNGNWFEFSQSQLFPLDRDSYSTESLSLVRYKVLVDK